MPTATLTSKGQITVPQAVREQLGLHSGDKVDFVADESGGFKMIQLRKDVTVLRGRFAGRAVRRISVQDMDGAIEAEAAERLVRSTGPARRRAK
ncbi:MAG: AbrB/MazE/SpoVT family DNA-binding domain-containing protein [Betaproteobacteria bacterium]|nr:AbrB/MazE/SpoVT family DNA-binding domain-containing protein [Betaproteobacteria bacterium]